MLVHSFSQDARWFGDFRAFAALFGTQVEADRPSIVTTNAGQRLRLGWATGNPEYLDR
jgi:hypothetical protein